MSPKLPFRKMHGAGNDFLMLAQDDVMRSGVRLDASRVARLCDRRRGIGADGLIVLGAHTDADFAMTYFNSDGGEAAMCGNGARCAFAFARDLGLVVAAGGVCLTSSGPVRGTFVDTRISVELTPPRDLRLDVTATHEHPFERLHGVDTGVPHLVVPVDDVASVDVPLWGRRLREDPAFAPQGTNVNWVAPTDDPRTWRVRTYERGVEAETLACGTGASAVALVLTQLDLSAAPVDLLTHGGDRLTIDIESTRDGTRLRLTGPAVTVFSGEVICHD